MAAQLPSGFRGDFFQCGEVRLHVVHNGAGEKHPLEDERPAILFLHGFPEFWIAWREVFKHLAKDYLVIAPDQRGYNLSDAPLDVEDYKANLLVGDMVSLTQKLLGERPFILAGHDWGASIAYALAMAIPERVSHLIIANGVHPVCFQEAMMDDPDQAAASQYFYVLRKEGAGQHMAAFDFQKTFSMFEKFSAVPWLNDALREEYRIAWDGPERLQAMAHWYSSSPIYVPNDDVPPPERTLYGASRDKFRISMPHLLLWGMRDQALLASSHEKLSEFCDDLTVETLENGDHWILHSHADWVLSHVTKFLAQKRA